MLETVNVSKYWPALLVNKYLPNKDMVGHSVILHSTKYLIHMQGWHISIWIFSPWLHITHLITENLLQYGLCHGDSKSHHNSYALLKVLWKNLFVVVVYYELSFLVHDVIQKYECIINALMLKLMSCNNLSCRSNWHKAFSKFKEIIKQKGDSFLYSPLNFSNVQVSPATATCTPQKLPNENRNTNRVVHCHLGKSHQPWRLGKVAGQAGLSWRQD